MLLLKTPSVLPGFKISLGLTVLCLSLLVVLPFAMMAAKAAEIGWGGFWNTIAEPNVLAAVWLSLRMSFYAMLTNVVFGTLVAWVLVRYEFPLKGLVNALVDLPFALPTAVTGIALATLYAPNGWIGRFFEPLGIKIAFKPIGIWIALVVVSLPFIVRAVQPVLEELSGEYEEAAATLGANRFTTFRRVLPPLSNEFITLVKDTSLIYVLALNDLLRAARGIVQRDFTITPFIVAAVFYLLMTLLLTWMFQSLEKRYASHDA